MVYFRTHPNALTSRQMGYLRDLGVLSRFKATSDLPVWLKPAERLALREFLESDPQVERLGRYCYRIAGREVDFASLIPLPGPKRVPAKLATALGLYDMLIHEALPAILESFKSRRK